MFREWYPALVSLKKCIIIIFALGICRMRLSLDFDDFILGTTMLLEVTSVHYAPYSAMEAA
jgi:hypothetical protein